jgi:hypothetical protein
VTSLNRVSTGCPPRLGMFQGNRLCMLVPTSVISLTSLSSGCLISLGMF